MIAELNYKYGNSAAISNRRFENQNIFPKMLPQILTDEQKQQIFVPSDLLNNAGILTLTITKGNNFNITCKLKARPCS